MPGDIAEIDRCVICGGSLLHPYLTCNTEACRAALEKKPEREISALRTCRVLAAWSMAPPGGKAFVHMTGRDGKEASGWVDVEKVEEEHLREPGGRETVHQAFFARLSSVHLTQVGQWRACAMRTWVEVRGGETYLPIEVSIDGRELHTRARLPAHAAWGEMRVPSDGRYRAILDEKDVDGLTIHSEDHVIDWPDGIHGLARVRKAFCPGAGAADNSCGPGGGHAGDKPAEESKPAEAAPKASELLKPDMAKVPDNPQEAMTLAGSVAADLAKVPLMHDIAEAVDNLSFIPSHNQEILDKYGPVMGRAIVGAGLLGATASVLTASAAATVTGVALGGPGLVGGAIGAGALGAGVGKALEPLLNGGAGLAMAPLIAVSRWFNGSGTPSGKTTWLVLGMRSAGREEIISEHDFEPDATRWAMHSRRSGDFSGVRVERKDADPYATLDMAEVKRHAEAEWAAMLAACDKKLAEKSAKGNDCHDPRGRFCSGDPGTDQGRPDERGSGGGVAVEQARPVAEAAAKKLSDSEVVRLAAKAAKAVAEGAAKAKAIIGEKIKDRGAQASAVAAVVGTGEHWASSTILSDMLGVNPTGGFVFAATHALAFSICRILKYFRSRTDKLFAYFVKSKDIAPDDLAAMVQASKAFIGEIQAAMRSEGAEAPAMPSDSALEAIIRGQMDAPEHDGDRIEHLLATTTDWHEVVGLNGGGSDAESA
jgi:hypothetical protein